MRLKPLTRASVAILTLLSLAFLIRPAATNEPLQQTTPDWPVFRGNAQQSGIAASELPDKLDILWRFEAKGEFEGTAAIVGGIVYVGSQDGHVYAVSLAKGEQKWKTKIGTPIRIGLAVDDVAVYAGDEDGKFHCLEIAAGQKRWMFDTEAEITSAPNLDGPRVLFGSGDQLLYCLDKDKGGKPLWTFKVPGGPVMGTPAVIDGKTFVAGCDSAMHVIDTKTGKELAEVELDGQVGATPGAGRRFPVRRHHE